ncbi:MAG: imidazole glycerol phosphate synthase subunit HisH [Calditrichia bacterium]|nr:imidazole glycerol phosphate synthase subunit HisH [Calditrichia bacterium]
MKVAIIKYNAGNIHSVRLALQRLGIEPQVTSDTELINAADKVIFPGVGEASTAMNFINKNGIAEVIKQLKQPVLGICLGLQLMGAHSEENDTRCLGIFNLEIKKFPPRNKVPHMGWNLIRNLSSRLFEGLPGKPYVYFVHSYYAEKFDSTIATTDYILPFSAAIKKDNFYAVQFHPEKSGKVGEQILRNFLKL